MDERSGNELDELGMVALIVHNMLNDWDRFPSLQSVTPHIALLRQWRDHVARRLEAEQHGDQVP